MKNTPNILAILIVTLSFGLLYGASSGLFKAPESLQTQNVQGVFGILMLIAGYFFGSSHRSNNNNETQTKMTKQVFWNIQALDDLTLEIDGVTSTAKVLDLPNIDSRFSIGPDDTNTDVLMVITTNPVTLKLFNPNTGNYTEISVVATFASGRPRRPQ